MRHETFPVEGRAARSQEERSRAQRASLSLLCEVRQGSQPWKLARLIDLSETGFRLAWLPEYGRARLVRIRIPGIEPLTARICWHEGRQIGCAFDAPLHVAVFEHIARLAGGGPAR